MNITEPRKKVQSVISCTEVSVFHRKLAYIALILGVIVGIAGCRRSKVTADQKAQLINQGDALMEKKDYSGAVRAYAAATGAGQDGPLLKRLSYAYLRAGNVQQYARTAMRAADVLPDDPNAQLDAGNALLRTRQFDDASTRADKVLAKDPKNIDALILRGNAAARMTSSEF